MLVLLSHGRKLSVSCLLQPYQRRDGACPCLFGVKKPGDCARPSLLDGNRAALSQPERGGERIGLLLARGLRPLLPANYRAILSKDVAQVLIWSVQMAKPGVVTLMSGEMQGGCD